MKNIIKYPEMDYIINCSGCGCVFECDRKEIKMVDYKDFDGEMRITQGTQCPLCNDWRNLDGEKIYKVQGTHK